MADLPAWWYRLPVVDRIYLIVYAALLGWILLDLVRSPEPDRGPDRVDGHDSFTLGERSLQRLEEGETVTVERWHGGEVTLAAEQVVLDVTDREEVDRET